MKQKDRSFSWTRTIYLLVALVLVSLALILLSQGRHLQPLESFANTVFTPIQQAASNVTSTVGGWLDGIGRTNDLEEENKRLRIALDAVTAENARLQETARETQQLQAMVRFQNERPEIQAVQASNIGGDPNGLSETLTIDRGSNASIKVGMAVVSPGGILVGQISAVKADRATVLLLTDISSSIPVATQRGLVPGVLDGQWQKGGNLLMQHIPRDSDVVKNDVLLTSGLGGTFPKGLICGQIFEVRQNDVQMEKQAVAIPMVELNSLENVLVITNGPSK
ncbi:MAG: rod shape-determining protein MreC [Chloroflexota bacterium]